MRYQLTLGDCGSVDCAWKINDKSYAIDSLSWELISLIEQFNTFEYEKINQKLLEHIYNNHDQDVIQKK